MLATLHRSYSSKSSASVRTSSYKMGMKSASGQSVAGDYANDFDFSSPFSPSCSELSVFGNEKSAMQNLNGRLAAYLEKVVSMERANLTLEQKIKAFYESRAPSSSKDLSKYYTTIEDLQKQIIVRTKEKEDICTKLLNSDLAASDFRMKFEAEKNMRLVLEADLGRMRTVHEEMKMKTKDLEMQMPSFKEELIFLKKNHEEELHMARAQHSGAVNVEVDCAPAVNLDKELSDMREQYEELIQKNRMKIEEWFQKKVKTLNIEVTQSHTEIASSKTAVSDLRKSYQALEIEINGLHTLIRNLQRDLVQVGTRYSEQLSRLQLYIDRLQTELQQITSDIHEQAAEYQLLLDIKMRLELEIAEYRRLLEGELQRSRSCDSGSESELSTKVSQTTTTKVTEMVVKQKQEIEEEHQLRQKRVKIITEELLNGVVVSHSVDEKLQDLSN